jgi:peroxidase
LTFRQLQRISDLSGCHRFKRRVKCSQRCLKYRTFDGTCNNVDRATRSGAANTALRRLLPAVYQNGFSTPRGWNKSQLYNGYLLPNPREVTNRLIATRNVTSDPRFSHMLMQWGQFVDHDLSHTVMAVSLNTFSNGIACRDSCTNEQPCFPIEVAVNDSLRRGGGHGHYHADGSGKCMEFVRSAAVCGSGETSLVMNRIHQREVGGVESIIVNSKNQINQNLLNI